MSLELVMPSNHLLLCQVYRLRAFKLGKGPGATWDPRQQGLPRGHDEGKESNQSILKEISPECSLEGLMLKLKFQYFGHRMQRADSLEKTLMLGKIEGRRRG